MKKEVVFTKDDVLKAFVVSRTRELLEHTDTKKFPLAYDLETGINLRFGAGMSQEDIFLLANVGEDMLATVVDWFYNRVVMNSAPLDADDYADFGRIAAEDDEVIRRYYDRRDSGQRVYF